MASRRSVNFGPLPPASQVRTYNVSQVIQLLEKANLTDCSRGFEKRQINGAMLLNLKDDDIMPWVGAGDLKVTHIRQIANLIKTLNSTPSPVGNTAKAAFAPRSFAPPAFRNPSPSPASIRPSLSIRPRPPLSQKPMTANRPSSFLYKKPNVANVAKPEPANVAFKPKITTYSQEEDEYEVPVTQTVAKAAPLQSYLGRNPKPSLPAFRAPGPPSFLAKIQQQQQQIKQQPEQEQRENEPREWQGPTAEEENVYSNLEAEHVACFKVAVPPPVAGKSHQRGTIASKEEKTVEEDIYANCEEEQVYDVPNNIPVVFPFTASQVPMPPPVQGTKAVEEEDTYEVPIVPPSSAIAPVPAEEKGKGFMTTLRSKFFSNSVSSAN